MGVKHVSTSRCRVVLILGILIAREVHIVNEKGLCFRTIRVSGNAYLFFLAQLTYINIGLV